MKGALQVAGCRALNMLLLGILLLYCHSSNMLQLLLLYRRICMHTHKWVEAKVAGQPACSTPQQQQQQESAHCYFGLKHCSTVEESEAA